MERIRTLYAPGKVQQVAKELKNYTIDLLGVSECRWTGSGKLRLNSGETVLKVHYTLVRRIRMRKE